MGLYMILADGIYWIDSDDIDAWPYEVAVSLAAMLEGMNYHTELIQTLPPSMGSPWGLWYLWESEYNGCSLVARQAQQKEGDDNV